MMKAKGQITIIYNASLLSDRQSLSYASSIRKHKLHGIDLTKTKLTRQQLAGLALDQSIEIKDLVDINNSEFQTHYGNHEFTDHDLLTLLINNPLFIKTPIIIRKNHVYHIRSAYDLVRILDNKQSVVDY